MILAVPAELVDRAFRMAYFLRPDLESALRVTATALAFLDAKVERQNRRSSYRPLKSRTRAQANRAQMLQRLVFCVSSSPEHHPRETPSSRDDLLIDFLVNLVQITTWRNSFYVNLGISRILHDYSTADAVAVQDFLTQDPEKVPAEAYFRYAKHVLLSELTKRFGSSVRTTRKARGEQELCSARPDLKQARLIEECLQLATPWQTRCAVPTGLDPRLEAIPELACRGQSPDDEHPIEWLRMHTVLHPVCYSRSVRALGLGAPSEHLRIPCFFGAGTLDESRDGPLDRLAPPLDGAGLAKIATELEAIAALRWRWSARALRA